MPSFDITCAANAVELKNAVDTANKEIANRFDFKGSDARIELKEKEHEITAFADDDFKLGQVRDVLYGKMAKRNVDAWSKVLDQGPIDAIIINASGCGTTVKDYGFMLRNDAAYAAKAARVTVICGTLHRSFRSSADDTLRPDKIRRQARSR